MKPITPKEAAIKEKNFPDEVIDAFNKLIAKNLHGKTSVVTQNEIINQIIMNMNGNVDRADIFSNNWLDIEDLYESYGWKVKYDKPGYYETYKASFTFTIK